MNWLEVSITRDLFWTQQNRFPVGEFLARLDWLDVSHFQYVFLQDLPDLVNVVAGDGDGWYEGGGVEEFRVPLRHVPDLQRWGYVTHHPQQLSSKLNMGPQRF